MANHIDARITWCIAWSAGVLSGCFYLEPVNRVPKVGEISWSCVGGSPSTPDQLRRGDTVVLGAMFDDRDGDKAKATLHWRVSACDVNVAGRCNPATCDEQRVYEHDDEAPAITVPQTLDTGGPVQCVLADVDVIDERGGLSSGTSLGDDHFNVAPGEPVCGPAPPAVVRRGPP